MGTSAFGTWQPISTAPTGTWIQTYSQDGVIRVAMWIKGAMQETHSLDALATATEGIDVMPRGPQLRHYPI